MRICVYGAASPTIDQEYKDKVKEMGKFFAERGHALGFGGGGHGLMGAAAEGFREGGAHIIGVIPKFFEEEQVEAIFEFCDELIQPDTMRERKQLMEDHADAFVIVPGGIGTFEEFFEILTLKQLCRHNKPIAIYNIKGYYNEIVHALEKATEKNFIRGGCMDLFALSESLEELSAYIEDPNPKQNTLQELKDG